MKLSLRASGDIQILTISGLRGSEDLAVLRAGVVNILRKGKNRVVLDLADSGPIPPDHLRELARLRLIANELSGDLVLVGGRPELRTQVSNFSNPPAVPIHESVEAAVQSFVKLRKTPAPPPVAPSPEEGSPAATAAEARQAGEFREQVLQREGGEIGGLRREVERLRAENRSLHELVAERLLSSRFPVDLKACHEKILLLEGQLAEILGKPPEKKPSA